MLRQLLSCFLAFGFLVCTAQSFTESFGAAYDAERDRWLITDGIQIKQMSGDGLGEVTKFGDFGSQGIEIIGEHAYAIWNGEEIRVFDLASETLVSSYTVPGAAFLGGLASNDNGKLYAGDLFNHTIFEIDFSDMENPSTQFLATGLVNTPAGLYFDQDKNKLLITTWSDNAAILGLDMDDLIMEVIIETEFKDFNGIVKHNSGKYFVSCTEPPQVIVYSDDFESIDEIIENPAMDGPLDLGYDAVNDRLAIPDYDTVLVYSIIGLDTDDITLEEYNINVSPNPITDNEDLTIDWPIDSKASLHMISTTGQIIYANDEVALNTEMPYTLRLSDLQLSAGIYWLKIQDDKGNNIHKQLIKN